MESRNKAIIAVVLAFVVVLAAMSQLMLKPVYEITAYAVDSDNPNIVVTIMPLNGGEISPDGAFSFRIYFYSSRNFTVSNISIATPGFALLSSSVTLPISSITKGNATMIGKVPPGGFRGEVRVTVNSTLGQLESFIIEDVSSNPVTKSVYFIGIRNNGGVPIQMLEVILWRSDGLVVNSTPVNSTYRLQPGAVHYYDFDLSYGAATILEVFYINATTTTGTNATSRPFPLACNCD